MNAFADGCLTPDFITEPLHSFIADFTIRFISFENRIFDIVSPVIMPFSSSCLLVFPLLYRKPTILLFDYVLHFFGK